MKSGKVKRYPYTKAGKVARAADISQMATSARNLTSTKKKLKAKKKK